MKEEAAYELAGVERHLLDLISVASVLIGKNNLAVFNRFYPFVGYGNAMGVAAKVAKHLFGPCKGGLGVYDLFLSFNHFKGHLWSSLLGLGEGWAMRMDWKVLGVAMGSFLSPVT